MSKRITVSELPTIQEFHPGTFIFEKRKSLPGDVCTEMIRRFEANPQDHYRGRIGQSADLDASIKKSTDVVVSAKPHWSDIDKLLFQALSIALKEFRQAFDFFSGPFKDMGYGIQRTLPQEHYHWHIDSGSHDFADRQLVAIWYLNDVAGPGGETEFLSQQIKIKPETGKLLLFPPFWTHEHRGVTLQNGVKYIATTWVVFA